MHPLLTRFPIAKLGSRRGEFYEKGKEAMEGGCSLQVGHPSSSFLRLANGACQIVSILGKGSIGQREFARCVERMAKGWSMTCMGPILAALSILRAKVIERLFRGPRLFMVQAMGEEQGELEEA